MNRIRVLSEIGNLRNHPHQRGVVLESEEEVEVWRVGVLLVLGLCHHLAHLGTVDMLMHPPNLVIPPHIVINADIRLDHHQNAGRAGLPVILLIRRRRDGLDHEVVQM